MKIIEIYIKNLFLNLLLVLNRRKKTDNKDIISFNQKKVLFIRLNRIGDALVTTPLLKLLKDNLNITIHVLADKKNFFIFENQPFVDKFFVFNKGIKGFLDYSKLIKNEKYDAIVDLHDDVSATVSFLLALSKNTEIFGLKKKNLNLYTKVVERKDSTKFHVVDRFIELAKLFGINNLDIDININYVSSENDFNWVTNFIKKTYTNDKPIIGINISAGSASRFWGINRYRQLVEYLKTQDVNILIISTTREVKTAFEISKGEIPIFYTPNFSTFSALISKLSLLFTPDTSTVHLASIYKVPIFGIYVKYKTDDIIWYSYKSRHAESVTTESNFNNLEFDIVFNDFKPFFEKIIYGK